MNPQLRTDLKRLNLSGLISILEVRLLETTANQLTPLEFLELLVSNEMMARQDRAIDRRVNEVGYQYARMGFSVLYHSFFDKLSDSCSPRAFRSGTRSSENI